MAREKRVRKPGAFKMGGLVVAACLDNGSAERRAVYFHPRVGYGWHARDLRRLTAWLARAQEIGRAHV